MSVARNTTYNLVGKLVPLAVALITVPIYMHVIGADRYGILAICWALLGYFGLFDLGLGVATSYRMAVLQTEPDERSANSSWTAFIVSATMGTVGAAIFWGIAHIYFTQFLKAGEGLRGEVLLGLPMLIISVPIAIVASVLNGCLDGRQRFLHTNSVNTASGILTQIVPLALAYFVSPHLVVVLFGAVVSRLIGAIGLGWLCHREYWRGQHPRVSREEAKALFKFGGWVTLNGILNPILSLADRLTIGTLLGASSVAAYSVPYSVAERTSVLPYAFTQALFPKMSGQTPEDRAELERRALLVLVAIMTLPTLIGVLLAEPLLSIWLGKTFDPRSAGVARVLLINFWLACFSLLTFVRLQASGRPNVVTKLLAIQMPIYVVGVYVGIKLFGLVGCAWALLGRQMLNYIQSSWVSNRRFMAWRTLAICLTCMVAAHVAAGYLEITDWRFGLIAAVLIIIAGVTTLRNLSLEPHAARFLGALRRSAT